jgi:hypothetical protein
MMLSCFSQYRSAPTPQCTEEHGFSASARRGLVDKQ